jgi:hypothetical protein
MVSKQVCSSGLVVDALHDNQWIYDITGSIGQYVRLYELLQTVQLLHVQIRMEMVILTAVICHLDLSCILLWPMWDSWSQNAEQDQSAPKCQVLHLAHVAWLPWMSDRL